MIIKKDLLPMLYYAIKKESTLYSLNFFVEIDLSLKITKHKYNIQSIEINDYRWANNEECYLFICISCLRYIILKIKRN